MRVATTNPAAVRLEDDELIDSAELARLANVSVSFLAKLRLHGGGPPYFKFGHKSVRYRKSVALAWLLSCERTSTSDDATRAA